MEGDSTDKTLRTYKKSLDRNIHGVMPETWAGHGRLTIRESNDLPPEKEEKAIAVLSRVLDKNPEYPAERVANIVIDKVKE